ncbi:MAG: hypothetical protein ABIS50_14860 [Luteolibacter sp.]|uniref:hypothetical protein n=1 Tax=Luteolibacter sp. TaxID=1962973 RepID=UPI0032633239
MNSYLHAFRTTFRRFRWEILAFWLLGAALLAAFASGGIRMQAPLELRFQIQPAYDRLEIIALGWIVLRLMASESVLMTQGGWRSRPISRLAAWTAPFGVLAATLLPLFLLRIIIIQQAVSPDARQWLHIFTCSFLPAAGLLLLAALILRAGAALISRRDAGRWKKVVFGLLCLAGIAVWFIPATRWPILRLLNSERLYRSGGGGMNFGNYVAGIQELLPPSGKYVGDWIIWSPPTPRMREVFRFKPKQGLVLRQPGIRVEMKHIRPSGNRLDLAFDIEAADPLLIDDLWTGVMVLRYAGNLYVFRRQSSDWQETPPVSVLPLTTIHVIGYFDSPVGYLWNERSWEELLQDAELMVFMPDKSRPPIRFLREAEVPKLEMKHPPGLAGEVETVLDELDTSWEHQKEMAKKGSTFPREAMPYILARHPWSDDAWENLIRPFLLKHSDESDKSAILERLPKEPRLGEIMVARGWQKEAIPLLRKFAADRLPLDADSLAALASEHDPALSSDLAALSARLPDGVEKLEPLLRDQPGFDWPAFVHDGWLRRKYSFRREGPIQPFNFWAAGEGDFSAFRYTAEQAARGEMPEVSQIAGLVEGEHDDLIGFLRENIDHMKFDPAARKWHKE